MSLKQNIVANTGWLLAERMGIQTLQFVLAIILARLLAVEEFGLLAMCGVFTAILSIIASGGMEVALVQKKDISECDCSSAFYLNFSAGLIAYGIVFVTASLVADFFQIGRLTVIIRVLAIALVFDSMTVVPRALLVRRLQFRKRFWISLVSLLVSMAVSLTLVWRQWGIWALVFQQLSYSFTMMIAFYVSMRWLPKFLFCFQTLWSMFCFGGKVMVTHLLHSLYGNFFTLLVGKLYSPVALGYYWRGERMAQFAIYGLNSCGTVLLPVFSEKQNQPEEIREMLGKSMRLAAYVLAPLVTLLVIGAEPVIVILLTDKWLPSVIFLQLMAIQYFFFPIQAINQQAYLARGHSKAFFYTEVLKKSLGLLAIILTYRIGLPAMAAAQATVAFAGLFITSWPNRRVIGYSMLSLTRDIAPPVTMAAVSGVIGYFCSLPFGFLWMKLLVMGAVQVSSYLFLSHACRLRASAYFWHLMLEAPLIRRFRHFWGKI